MATKRIVSLLIVFGVCGGCSERRGVTGSLAIMELVYSDRTELVYLSNDYGFLIQWIDNSEPEFYLYNKPSRRIQMTSDFHDFLAGLKAFPNGAKVDRIRGCAITEHGMPEDYKARLRETIKAKSFHLTDQNDGNFPVCECETIKVRRYRTASRQPKPDGAKDAGSAYDGQVSCPCGSGHETLAAWANNAHPKCSVDLPTELRVTLIV